MKRLPPLHLMLMAVVLALSVPSQAASTPVDTITPPAPGQVAEMPTVSDLVDMINKATAAQPQDTAPEWSTPVKLVVIFTLLALLPSVLAMTTSFTRIVIVLTFVRQALGTQSIPPTTALMGLALFLTVFTMAPTLALINDQALQPYLSEQIDFGEMSLRSSQIIREFMLRQTRPEDVRVFIQMSGIPLPKTAAEMPMYVVVPAFVISEFRTSFEIGCLIFIPFLLLDLVIASVLLSAGMMMLPPVMISLPFKLILFILIDGWGLLANSLSLSFK